MYEHITYAVRRYEIATERPEDPESGHILAEYQSAQCAEEARKRLRKNTPESVGLDVLALEGHPQGVRKRKALAA